MINCESERKIILYFGPRVTHLVTILHPTSSIELFIFLYFYSFYPFCFYSFFILLLQFALHGESVNLVKFKLFVRVRWTCIALHQQFNLSVEA